MYNNFFRFESLPFSLTPNPNFFCELRGHVEALNTLHFCIQSGEGFIKIVGEVGTGKTLLCRKLLSSLDDSYITAYIPNPELSPIEMRKALARELGLTIDAAEDQHELLSELYNHLIKLHAQNKKVVLLIDEAQVLSDESLETIRLLTNLETEQSKLLQVVLFGQPELNQRLQSPHLRQLNQRITFSYCLPLMNKNEMDVYLNHRLAVAGHTHGNLFTERAKYHLFRASRGIPRLVNILSHKALLAAYGRGKQMIDHKDIQMAICDTDSVVLKRTLSSMVVPALFVLSFIFLMVIIWGVGV